MEVNYSEVIPTRPGHYVYRLWADDVCLYVGCVGERLPKRPRYRLTQHRGEKPWWPQVTRIDVAGFSSREEIIAEETRQIAALRPVHNRKLLGECSKGHDLTIPGARSDSGECRQCRIDYQQKPEVKRRKAARDRTSESRQQHAAYMRLPESRTAAAARKRKYRRQGKAVKGQISLW